jgi:hypothetical protein
MTALTSAGKAVKPDLVNDLARFAANIAAEQLDCAVVKAIKTNILDTLSCALAGSSAPAIAEVTGLVREWGGAPAGRYVRIRWQIPSTPHGLGQCRHVAYARL